MGRKRNRGTWARTNNDQGFKVNTPDGWAVDNGPVWWYGSDSVSALMAGPARQSHSAITKATNVIVGTLTSGRWELDDGSVPTWISDPMNMRGDRRFGEYAQPVGRRLPGPFLWGQWIRSALLAGMGYLAYTPNLDGTPVPGSLLLVPAGNVTHDQWTGTGIRIDQGAETLPVSDDGVIRGTGLRLLILRNPLTPVDPLTGVTPGVLEFHAAELGVLASMTSYSQGTFTGGGVPSGYLKLEQQITQDQADMLKQRWMAAHGSGARSVAVLNAGASYQPVSISPIDAALADMTRLMLVAVANAFSVPYALLAAPTGDSLTYSTLQMNLQSLDFALSPWKDAVAATLSPLIPAGRDVHITVINGVDVGRGAPDGRPVVVGADEPAADVPQG